MPLSQKAQARGFFSPDDMGKLLEAKATLMDIMNAYPKALPLAKPVYDCAVIFRMKERYDDAYDFFNYLSTYYGQSPYGLQAKVEIQRMKQKLGEKYFADMAGGAK